MSKPGQEGKKDISEKTSFLGDFNPLKKDSISSVGESYELNDLTEAAAEEAKVSTLSRFLSSNNRKNQIPGDYLAISSVQF